MSYNINRKLWAALLAQTLLACALSGCSSTPADLTSDADTLDNSDAADTASDLDTTDMFSDRDYEIGYDAQQAVQITLADGGSTCTDSAVAIDGDTVTISAEGTYLLSGSLSDGQVIVDAPTDAKLQLVLDNVSVNRSTSAAIYVRQADKVFLTTASGSVNTLTNTSAFEAIDDHNIDAVIFARCDLTINGSGTLNINAVYGHGIVSKDDLVITGSTCSVSAQNHALSGKDSVRISDGVLMLTAGTDGIHSENTDNAQKGFIYIAGGDIRISCGSDGLDGDYTVQIAGGNLKIAAEDDGIHSDSDMIITDGSIAVTESYEGLEGKTVTIAGGEITINAADDGVNAAGDGKTTGGSDVQTEGTSTEPADKMELPTDGKSMPEFDKNPPTDGGTPPERDNETMPGGKTPPDRSDESIPEDIKNDKNPREFDKNPTGAGGPDEATDYNWITISGGSLSINAGGDGIDSNGDLTVSGGAIYIDGPDNGGNGALDYAGSGSISGGTVVAVGASGMAQSFGADSTQGTMLVTVSDEMQTGALTLTDENGNTLVSYTPAKAYNSVLISVASVTEGSSYTLVAGAATTVVEMTALVTSVR